MAAGATLDWKTRGLHHWSMLALLFGVGPPVPIDGTLPALGVEARLALVSKSLGISVGRSEVQVQGPGTTGTFVINDRLINKMRDEAYAARTPFIPWAPHAINNAIEVWQSQVASKGEFGPELRTYFLAPLAYAAENECYLAIAGADSIVFNVMRCDAGYANALRKGALLFAKQTLPCGTLCCERYVELRSDLVKARATVLELQQKNRKLRELLKRSREDGVETKEPRP